MVGMSVSPVEFGRSQPVAGPVPTLLPVDEVLADSGAAAASRAGSWSLPAAAVASAFDFVSPSSSAASSPMDTSSSDLDADSDPFAVHHVHAATGIASDQLELHAAMATAPAPFGKRR